MTMQKRPKQNQINSLGLLFYKERDDKVLSELIDVLRLYFLRILVKRYPFATEGNRNEAINDAIYSIWERIDQYNENLASFKTWATAIVINSYIRIVRDNANHRKRLTNFSENDSSSIHNEDAGCQAYLTNIILNAGPEEEIEGYKCVDLEGLIQNLSPVYQDIVWDKHVNHLSYKKLNKKYGLNINTLKTRVRIGTNKIKELYAECPHKYTGLFTEAGGNS